MYKFAKRFNVEKADPLHAQAFHLVDELATNANIYNHFPVNIKSYYEDSGTGGYTRKLSPNIHLNRKHDLTVPPLSTALHEYGHKLSDLFAPTKRDRARQFLDTLIYPSLVSRQKDYFATHYLNEVAADTHAKKLLNTLGGDRDEARRLYDRLTWANHYRAKINMPIDIGTSIGTSFGGRIGMLGGITGGGALGGAIAGALYRHHNADPKTYSRKQKKEYNNAVLAGQAVGGVTGIIPGWYLGDVYGGDVGKYIGSQFVSQAKKDKYNRIWHKYGTKDYRTKQTKALIELLAKHGIK